MKKYEVKFELGSKCLLSILNCLSTDKNTQTILADSERDVRKRLEAMYPDKSIKIILCKQIN